MKYIFTLFTVIFSLTVFAQKSNLIIFNNGGQPFFVILNGIKQNSIPRTNVKIEGLNPAAYKVKVIFADGTTGDINKSIYLDPNMEYSAQVVIKSAKKRNLRLFDMVAMNTSPYGNGSSVVNYRSNENTVYSDQPSTTNGSGQATPIQLNGSTQVSGGATHTHADGTVHNEHHEVIIKNPVPSTRPIPVGQGTHTHADGTVHDHNHQVITKPGIHTHADGTVHADHATPAPVATANGNVIVNADGTWSCKSALDNVDYVISGIKEANFSSDQMAFVQETLSRKCINSDQAYRIVNAFTFDGDRIKMAKFCYDHMTDRANANKLLDLFSFSSSKDELRKYFNAGK